MAEHGPCETCCFVAFDRSATDFVIDETLRTCSFCCFVYCRTRHYCTHEVLGHPQNENAHCCFLPTHAHLGQMICMIYSHLMI